MKKLLNFLGALSPAYTNWIMMRGKWTLVGRDGNGNRYYRGHPRPGYARDRRCVLYYTANPEASQVPPEWHGWLHHQTDGVPADAGVSFRRPWQKAPVPNTTGTVRAYHPPGHVLATGRREKSAADYEPWIPG